MSDPAARYILALEVRDEDIDELDHVNNIVYLRWVQDAATAHWRDAAHPEDQASLAWVVVRHEIDYLRPAQRGDRIVAETWVGPAPGRDFERHTELRRERDGRVVARARTLWCPIDRATGRPTRVNDRVRTRFSVG